MLNKDDMRVEVGAKAYELYTGKTVYKYIQIYPECTELRYGVHIQHIPTGKSVYCNSEKSQRKNLIKAFNKLEQKIGV